MGRSERPRCLASASRTTPSCLTGSAASALPYALPIEVHIDPGGYASAGWGPPISLKPGNGSSLDVVRYLLVAEVVEMLMLAQNKGWFASDGSNVRALVAEGFDGSTLASPAPGRASAATWPDVRHRASGCTGALK